MEIGQWTHVSFAKICTIINRKNLPGFVNIALEWKFHIYKMFHCVPPKYCFILDQNRKFLSYFWFSLCRLLEWPKSQELSNDKEIMRQCSSVILGHEYKLLLCTTATTTISLKLWFEGTYLNRISSRSKGYSMIPVVGTLTRRMSCCVHT